MQGANLIEGMGFIDDELAEEVFKHTSLSGRRVIYKWLAMAACLAIIALVVWGAMRSALFGLSEVAEATSDAPRGSELVQTDPNRPFALIDVDDIQSVYFSFDNYDPWELNDDEVESFLEIVEALHIDPNKPLTDFNPDAYDGDYHSRQFIVEKKDGSTIVVFAYGSTIEYGSIVYINGVPYSANEDAVNEIYNLYREYAQAVREANGATSGPLFNPESTGDVEGSLTDFWELLSGEDVKVDGE